MIPGEPVARTPRFDLVVVGCGLRATGLLTATPELLHHRVGIVDSRDHLGVGAFDGYEIESNSAGSDFFGWVDPAGPFGPLLDTGPVASLRSRGSGFPLPVLAEALREAGRALRQALPPESVMLGTTVTGLEAGAGAVRLRTADGQAFSAGTVVLATGIHEPPMRELDIYGVPVSRSSELFAPTSRELCDQLMMKPGVVCVLGGSHSAFSIVGKLLAAHARPRGEVVILSRSPVKVHYDSWDEYAVQPHHPVEAIPDQELDICPETGALHRYSGLRNGSKRLFAAVAGCAVPGVRLVVADSARAREGELRRADHIVQATGYRSSVPQLSRSGVPVACSGDTGVVQTTENGRLRCAGGGGDFLDDVFVMGMDPYPYSDNSVNPTSQYARRGRHLLEHLSRREAVSAAGASRSTGRTPSGGAAR